MTISLRPLANALASGKLVIRLEGVNFDDFKTQIADILGGGNDASGSSDPDDDDDYPLQGGFNNRS